MEIELTIRDQEINEDLTREADGIIRTLFKKYPNAIWEKNGEGYKILI